LFGGQVCCGILFLKLALVLIRFIRLEPNGNTYVQVRNAIPQFEHSCDVVRKEITASDKPGVGNTPGVGATPTGATPGPF